MLIRERIRYLRKEILKMNQAEFGKAIDLSGSNVGNIEVGRVNITERVISDICDVFDVNEDWLRNGNGEPLKELLPEDEYSKAAAGIANDNDQMAMEVLTSYFALDPQSKAAVKKFISDIADRLKKKQDET